MCADYTPSRSDQIEQHFAVRSPQFDLPPEAWPGYMAPIIRASHDVPGELEVAPACFGMVPHWADLKLARQTYNARTETVAQKPSFRNAWLCTLDTEVEEAFDSEVRLRNVRPVRSGTTLARER